MARAELERTERETDVDSDRRITSKCNCCVEFHCFACCHCCDCRRLLGFKEQKRPIGFQKIKAMDLSKIPNDKKLELCQWYFRAGFALLPFIWAVNAIWFFNEAFRKPEFEQQSQIKRYVIYSAIGALMWTAIIVTWIIVFQTHRVAWGQFGDDISIIIPVGDWK